MSWGNVMTALPTCLRDSSETNMNVAERRREFQTDNIGGQPQSNTRSDRDQDNIICGQRCHPEATDKIGRSADAPKSVIDRRDRRQAVDRGCDTRRLSFRMRAPAPLRPSWSNFPIIGRSVPAPFGPHLTHDNVLYHHTYPITLLDDGDVGDSAARGLATGNRFARSDSGCAAKGTGLGR